MTSLFSNLLPQKRKHEFVQNKVLTQVFILTLVILTPFVFVMYKRSQLTDSGRFIFYIDVFGLCMISVFSFVKGIPNKVKIYLYIILMFVVNTIGMYTMGYFAAGKYLFLLLVVISVVYLPMKSTITLLIASVVCYSTIAYLYYSGKFVYNFDIEIMAKSHVLWFSDGLVLLFLAVIVMVVVGMILKAFKNEVTNLEQSEKILINTIQDLPVPTVIVNKDLCVLFVNKRFETNLGFNLSEVPTTEIYFNKVYPHKEEREKYWKEWSSVMKVAFASQKIPPVIEYPFYDGKGNRRWTEIHYSISGDKAVIMFVDTTEKRDRQKEMINAMVDAEEAERSRVAKELHDGLGPLVSTAKIYAHTLNQNSKDEKIKKQGDRLVELLDETLGEIRTISNNVSPHILRNYGIKDALKSFVDKIKPISNVSFNLSFEYEGKIPHSVEFTLYRSLVEMINNSLKYAEAEDISITIKDKDEGFEIVYCDDGKGFNYKDALGKGFGLFNMQSRIQSLGGYFEYITEPGKGVKVIIEIS